MSFLTVPQDNERQKHRHRGGEMLGEGSGLELFEGRALTLAPDPSIEPVDDEFDPYPQSLDGHVDS